MKLFFLITAMFFVIGNTNAQVISRNKATAIENIKNAGYTVNISSQDQNAFDYVRYDQIGKCRVYFECTGTIVRKVTFLCEDGMQSVKRSREIYKDVSRADGQRARDEFGNPEPNEFFAYNTSYYNGKAKYAYNNDYTNQKWYFTITILE